MRAPKRIVEITWVDACTADRGGWADLPELAKFERGTFCKTIGFLIRRTPEALVVAASYTMDAAEEAVEQVSGTFVIPKGMISSVRILNK